MLFVAITFIVFALIVAFYALLIGVHQWLEGMDNSHKDEVLINPVVASRLRRARRNRRILTYRHA